MRPPYSAVKARRQAVSSTTWLLQAGSGKRGEAAMREPIDPPFYAAMSTLL